MSTEHKSLEVAAQMREQASDLNPNGESNFAVPEDFPRPKIPVSGVQPSLSMAVYGGRHYGPCATPPQLHARWQVLEEMAQELAGMATRATAKRKPAPALTTVLEGYLKRLIPTECATEDELRWTIRRTASLLGCVAPKSAAPRR